jgi:hypothetical protein
LLDSDNRRRFILSETSQRLVESPDKIRSFVVLSFLRASVPIESESHYQSCYGRKRAEPCRALKTNHDRRQANQDQDKYQPAIVPALRVKTSHTVWKSLNTAPQFQHALPASIRSSNGVDTKAPTRDFDVNCNNSLFFEIIWNCRLSPYTSPPHCTEHFLGRSSECPFDVDRHWSRYLTP